MKVVIEPSVFNKALKTIQPAIQSSPAIPILENVKCTVNGDVMELSGTNTNITISVVAKVKSKEDGVFLLPFKQLYSIVSLSDLPIEITVDKSILIKIGVDKFNFGTPSDIAHYPTRTEGEYVYTFPVNSEFISNLKSASKFTVKDTSGFNCLSNVCVDLLGDKVAIVSSDKNSLFYFEEPIQTKSKTTVLTDSMFINALPLIEDGEISISERVIKFSNDDVKIYGTLSDQPFVNYKFALREHKTNCIVNRKDLVESLNKILALKVISTTTELSFDTKCIKLKFDESEFNRDYNTVIKSEHKLSLPPMFLSAAVLKSLLIETPQEENVWLSFSDEKTQVYLDSEDGKNIAFIMPQMMLNN